MCSASLNWRRCCSGRSLEGIGAAREDSSYAFALSSHSLTDEPGRDRRRWVDSGEAPLNGIVVHSLDCTPKAKRSCRMTIILFAINHRLEVEYAYVLERTVTKPGEKLLFSISR